MSIVIGVAGSLERRLVPPCLGFWKPLFEDRLRTLDPSWSLRATEAAPRSALTVSPSNGIIICT